MSSLKISVIIPAYNAEAYLAAAIESVLQQTVCPAEVIVVDDNSTDRTSEIARRFGSAVNYQRRPPEAERGISAGRNYGIGLAREEWLAFLDADDLWTPHKLEWQCAAAKQNEGVGIFFGGVEQFISPELDRVDELRLAPPLDTTAVPHAGSMLVRREIFDRVGLFDCTLKMSEFIDWFARARDLSIPMISLPQILMRRRRHLTHTSLRQKDHLIELAAVLKRSLDRRRQSAANP